MQWGLGGGRVLPWWGAYVARDRGRGRGLFALHLYLLLLGLCLGSAWPCNWLWDRSRSKRGRSVRTFGYLCWVLGLIAHRWLLRWPWNGNGLSFNAFLRGLIFKVHRFHKSTTHLNFLFLFWCIFNRWIRAWVKFIFWVSGWCSCQTRSLPYEIITQIVPLRLICDVSSRFDYLRILLYERKRDDISWIGKHELKLTFWSLGFS